MNWLADLWLAKPSGMSDAVYALILASHRDGFRRGWACCLVAVGAVYGVLRLLGVA